MKDVFVLYGRKDFCEGVFDHDGNYFEESPVLEVFDSYRNAYNRFKQYVNEAYHNVKDIFDMRIDSDNEDIIEEKLFNDYNTYQGSFDLSLEEWFTGYNEFYENLPEAAIQWRYKEKDEEYAMWQMNVEKFPLDEQTPILPGLFIKKLKINSA